MHYAGRVLKRPLVLGLLLVAACSKLPDYGLPRVAAEDILPSSHCISYRQLTLADFRSSVLPDYLQDHEQDLHAHSTVAIYAQPGAHYVFTARENEKGLLYCGGIENLIFHACLLPEKSWWNPRLAKDKEAHVLQHEQVHFAIMEHAAWKLNQRVAQEVGDFNVCAAEKEAVVAGLSARLDHLLADSQRESLKQNGDFDAATSRLFDPAVQQWWYEQVLREISTAGQANEGENLRTNQ